MTTPRQLKAGRSKPKQKQPKPVQKQYAKTYPPDSYPPRIQGETSKSYAAFCAYLDMPTNERSLRALASKLKTQPSVTGEWSHKHQWQARASTWDDTRRRERLENIANIQREIDLLVMETHLELRSAACRVLIDEDAISNLGTIARKCDSSSIAAIKLLFKLSGLEDYRRLELERALREPPRIEAAADPAIVAALATATPEQLAALRGPRKTPAEYDDYEDSLDD